MTDFNKKIIRLLITASAVIILSSCASVQTKQDQYQDALNHYASRNYEVAAAVIESYKDTSYKEKDRVLFYLDTGMLYHYAGKYEKSNEALSLAEQGIEDLYTKVYQKHLHQEHLTIMLLPTAERIMKISI